MRRTSRRASWGTLPWRITTSRSSTFTTVPLQAVKCFVACQVKSITCVLNCLLILTVISAWSHARIIISSNAEGKNLWKLGAIKDMCTLEKDLESLYSDICETQGSGKCCRPWSLTNYLLLSSNKSACEDIEVTNQILQLGLAISSLNF
jgi:hypothetical protein